MKATVTWEGKLQFSAIGDRTGHRVEMDAASDHGGEGQGATPTELVIMGLAGCTGIDLMIILNKMRIGLEGLTIDVDAERSAQPPGIFTAATLYYHFRGQDLPADKIEHAVHLSLEKYCPVVGTLRQAISIHYCLEINGQAGPVRPLPGA